MLTQDNTFYYFYMFFIPVPFWFVNLPIFCVSVENMSNLLIERNGTVLQITYFTKRKERIISRAYTEIYVDQANNFSPLV